jgi:hypothetical protein
VAAQNPTDGAGSKAELGAQPVLAPSVLETGSDDPPFDPPGRLGRQPVRSRGAIVEAGVALGVVASHPPMSALAGHPHRFGDMGDRHPEIPHPMHEQAATMNSQTSVTVTHEDLRVVKTSISTAPEVFALGQRPVTNVPAEYT